MEDLEDSSCSEKNRQHCAYMKASDDFQIFSDDIDTDNDDDVRQFFGIEAPLEGYYIDGTEYALEDVYVCPNCEDITVKEDLEKIWEYYYENRPYDSSIFICDSCGSDYNYKDKCFIDYNEHVPMEELISRCV